MQFKLLFEAQPRLMLKHLEVDKSKKRILKQIRKVLGFMETNLKHPSLNTHKYSDFVGPKGEEVFESYVQNNSPSAYRIFWFYGPGKSTITILAITSHP